MRDPKGIEKPLTSQVAERRDFLNLSSCLQDIERAPELQLSHTCAGGGLFSNKAAFEMSISNRKQLLIHTN